MIDADYAELRMRLMAHQVLLCAVLASHPDKALLSACLAQATEQMKALHLGSALGDAALSAFDQELKTILGKSGLLAAGG